MIEKKLRRYIMPNVLAMVGLSCYLLADTYFVSKAAGADGITALNLILPVYSIIFAIGAMIGVGSATRYTLDKSLGNRDCDSFFTNSLFWTLVASMVFVVAGIWFPDNILRFMGADDNILGVGHTYIRLVLCFAPFFMANYTFTAFVRNDGAPSVAMAATLASGIFNIIFDYLFMFPLHMGMAGAALATCLSPIVSISVCMTHYLSKKNNIRLVAMRPSVRMLLSSCSLGIVALIGEISSGVTTMVFNFILLDLVGNTAVAAYGVIANTALVGTALFNGVSQGLQPVAGETHGKGEKALERRIYKHSVLIALVLSVVLVGIVFVLGDVIVDMFNSEKSAELARYAETGIRLYFIGFVMAAVNIVRAGFYSATGRGSMSSVIAVSRGVVAIVVSAIVLSRLFGVVGVWLAFPASELTTYLIGTVLEHRMKKISYN